MAGLPGLDRWIERLPEDDYPRERLYAERLEKEMRDLEEENEALRKEQAESDAAVTDLEAEVARLCALVVALGGDPGEVA